LNRCNSHVFTEKNSLAEDMFNILTIIRLQQKNTTQSTDRIHRKKILWWRLFKKSFNFFYVKDESKSDASNISTKLDSNDKKSSKKKKITERNVNNSKP
jgi:hypothetical protein